MVLQIAVAGAALVIVIAGIRASYSFLQEDWLSKKKPDDDSWKNVKLRREKGSCESYEVPRRVVQRQVSQTGPAREDVASACSTADTVADSNLLCHKTPPASSIAPLTETTQQYEDDWQDDYSEQYNSGHQSNGDEGDDNESIDDCSSQHVKNERISYASAVKSSNWQPQATQTNTKVTKRKLSKVIPSSSTFHQRKHQRDNQIVGQGCVSVSNLQIFRNNNQGRPRNEIDLHDLLCDEAVCVAKECISTLKNESFKYVDLITGRGSHSGAGQARVKGALKKLLKSSNYRYHWENPGMLRVFFRS